MKAIRTLALLFSVAMVFCALNQTARAGEWDKLTVLTFPNSVQVPGAVLGPGTYVFKLADGPSNRDIVQIFNHDQSGLITTILAVPDFRLDANDGSVIRFAERPADQPPAIAEWFYPGDNFGQEFIYPNSQPAQMAQVNASEMPAAQSDQPASQSQSTPAVTPQTTAPQTTAPQTGSTPATTPDTSAGQTNANSTATPAPADNPTTSTTNSAQLPQTASSLPLIGLSGLLCVAVGLVLRRRARA